MLSHMRTVSTAGVRTVRMAAKLLAWPQPYPSRQEMGPVGKGTSPYRMKWDHTTTAPSAEEDGTSEGLS